MRRKLVVSRQHSLGPFSYQAIPCELKFTPENISSLPPPPQLLCLQAPQKTARVARFLTWLQLDGLLPQVVEQPLQRPVGLVLQSFAVARADAARWVDRVRT